MMSHSDFIAIQKFANDLKAEFVVIANPRDFTDRIMNTAKDYARKIIDSALERAKWEFEDMPIRSIRRI